jgi:hypothetical protein
MGEVWTDEVARLLLLCIALTLTLPLLLLLSSGKEGGNFRGQKMGQNMVCGDCLTTGVSSVEVRCCLGGKQAHNRRVKGGVHENPYRCSFM